MNLHEYQAKQILAKYGLNVQQGILATTPSEVGDAFDKIGEKCAVLKAQVHTGGRGKAGGVKVVKSKQEAIAYAENILGTRLVTNQTDALGLPVNLLYVSRDVYPMQRELYLGAVIDRSTQKIMFIASTEGGVSIEDVAHNTPEKLLKLAVDSLVGLQPCHAREIGYKLNLNETQIKQFVTFMLGCYSAFIENDLSLLEINPLTILADGNLICIDTKMVIDDNALFRHPELAKLKDDTQENPLELAAAKSELNYVALTGNIGCMVNGAGLAMATMDIIKLYGGLPANFLDVGGSATKQRVVTAFKLILSEPSVKAVLINIFGGIVRCDMIAEAIITAMKEVQVNVPVVVRLEGNNAELGVTVLKQSGLNLIPAFGLDDAAKKVVATLKK